MCDFVRFYCFLHTFYDLLITWFRGQAVVAEVKERVVGIFQLNISFVFNSLFQGCLCLGLLKFSSCKL